MTHVFKSVPALQDADAPRKTSSAQQPWRWWPNDMFIDGASIQEFVETALEILFTLPSNLNLATGRQVCQIVGVCCFNRNHTSFFNRFGLRAFPSKVRTWTCGNWEWGWAEIYCMEDFLHSDPCPTPPMPRPQGITNQSLEKGLGHGGLRSPWFMTTWPLQL